MSFPFHIHLVFFIAVGISNGSKQSSSTTTSPHRLGVPPVALQPLNIMVPLGTTPQSSSSSSPSLLVVEDGFVGDSFSELSLVEDRGYRVLAEKVQQFVHTVWWLSSSSSSSDNNHNKASSTNHERTIIDDASSSPLTAVAVRVLVLLRNNPLLALFGRRGRHTTTQDDDNDTA